MKKFIWRSLFFSCLYFSSNGGISKTDTKFLIGWRQANLQSDTSQIKRYQKILLDNLNNHYTLLGRQINAFDTIFPVLEKMQEKGLIGNHDKGFQEKWDQLVRDYGSPNLLKSDRVKDKALITGSLLHENLSWSLKVKDEKGWNKSISDSVFINYILPYRFGTERVEDGWRKHLYTEYNFVKKKGKGKQEAFDEKKNSDLIYFASEIQYEIKNRVSTNGTLWDYPFDIPISKMEQGKQSACRHLVGYTTSVMRALGIPMTSDFTLLWGNNRTGHTWNVLFNQEREIPFDAAIYPLSFDVSNRKFVKVYRQQFLPEANYLAPSQTDVPAYLHSPFWKDVTEKYTKTANISVSVPENIAQARKHIMLGTFNNVGFKAQVFSPIKQNRSMFLNMGTGNVYIAMFMERRLKTFGGPFILDSLGKIKHLRITSERKNMVLDRKFPCTNWVRGYMESMLGGKFQVANKPDFTDSITIHSVNESPTKFETVNLSSKESYRYFRYVPPKLPKTYLAEIEFYNASGVKLKKSPFSLGFDDGNKLVDSDLNTFIYCNSPIVFDFGKQVNISKFKYAPRSDSNFILEGDSYQLLYWDDGQWVPFKTITAKNSKLIFENVPQGCLYLLVDLTKGNEQRIFTYEHGKQVWW